MTRNQKGFTLIELVMVIVILAILAAVAVPRFIDLQSEARISSAKGIGGALAGAANILHAQFILKATNYVLGTTDGPDTGVLFNANIAGATVIGVPNDVTVVGGSALITITVNNTPYTMTYTAGSPTLGPRVRYNF
ncbi:MAG: prepilin-type N-terminal cleavage/methylation domain-containing protein [Thermodesulfobacteriota bacterium]